MASRLDLQEMLETLAESRNVYFQPPESIKMNYPAIVYSRHDEEVAYADDMKYFRMKAYRLIVIDRDPDSELDERVSNLPYCRFTQSYQADNLNHFVYTLYY